MRFFHPGPNTSTTFVPGASRRRRERFRAHQAEQERLRALAAATALESLRWDWWGSEGRILASEPGEAVVHSTAPTTGALRVVQGCGYDPGNAAYRFHTALNECTKHASAFI